jgi:hypothetical protein
MNTKIIVALIAFFTTFGFSAGLTKYFLGDTQTKSFVRFNKERKNSTRNKILRLLDKDISNGRLRDSKIANNPFNDDSALQSYVAATEEYVDKSSSLDDSNLPEEFQTAWREHMKAWQEHSEFLNSVNTLQDRDTMRQYRYQDREISRTWYKVLSVAARHNAYPANAY